MCIKATRSVSRVASVIVFYDDKKGIRHYVTEIYAENMELLTPRNASSTKPQAVDASQQQGAGVNKIDTQDDALLF